MELNFLGRVELRPDYRDTSRPTVLSSPDVLSEYRHIAAETQKALDAVSTPA